MSMAVTKPDSYPEEHYCIGKQYIKNSSSTSDNNDEKQVWYDSIKTITKKERKKKKDNLASPHGSVNSLLLCRVHTLRLETGPRDSLSS